MCLCVYIYICCYSFDDYVALLRINIREIVLSYLMYFVVRVRVTWSMGIRNSLVVENVGCILYLLVAVFCGLV